MKHANFGRVLACALCLTSAHAGQVEADFNDLYLGDTRTRGSATSKNDGNLNTGTGFTPATATATGGSGEYNNNTGVVMFEKGDLSAPPGVAGFISSQGSPVDADATGFGVVFGSSRETGNAANKYRRFQERSLTPALTGSEIWFSFLFRLDGPLADARVLFNKPSTENSSDPAAAAFAISMGHGTEFGRVAIDVTGDSSQAPPAVGTPGAFTSVEVADPSSITNHLIIGRVIVNPAGDDTIEVWLDPSTTATLDTSTPTITATDEIGSGGITSVGFEGTRQIAPTPSGGPYTDGGHSAIDHFRMSDEANALDFVTGNVVVDPKLIIDPSSAATSFNFRGVYGSGSPVTSAPITVTLKNDGQNNPITINSVALATASPVFTITSPPISGLVLQPQETVAITVEASSDIFETTYTNSIVVDTSVPAQNLSIGVGATFYTSGSRVNPNPHFEANIDGWINDAYGLDNTPPIRVTPGFMGSGGMVRLRGIADPSGGAPDNISQTVLNGAGDWEFTFAFSPIDRNNFASYAGSEPVSFDRTFQVVIQSDGDVPTPAAATGGQFNQVYNADAAMINFAYLPADDQGFCVFNGSNWEPVGLPLIVGSTDTDNNGVLNGSDSINYYVVRIKGTGFGTGAAKYSITLSQANSSATLATVENLSTWSSTTGLNNTPGAYTFTTGDVSTSGNVNETNARATSFWIDEVSFYSSAVRDPAMTVGANYVITSHNGVTTGGFIPVTNTGFDEDLEISSVTFGKPTVFSCPATIPIVIAPGTTVNIPVDINPANFTPPDNSAFTNTTLATNIALQPGATFQIYGAGTTDANLVPNWNFETPGTDQNTDYDTFAFWDEVTGANLSKDMPGLLSGSTKGVHIATGAAIRTKLGAPAGNFVIDTPFAIRDTTLRAMNVNVHGTAGSGGPALNIRYEADKLEVFSTAWNTAIDLTGTPLAPSIDANANLSLNDAGDTKNVYKLRITGTGWDTGTPTYDLQILDASDNVIAASATGLDFFQNGTPSGGALYYTLTASAGGTGFNAGFWADDVLATTASAGPGVVITGLAGGPGNFTINWDSAGSPAIVERSYTLLDGSWEVISETGGDPDGTITDSTLPPDGKAFYRVIKN